MSEPFAAHTLNGSASEMPPLRHGLAEFESCLASKTKVPPERLTDYLQWSSEQIRNEAGDVARILRRFARAVVDAMEAPENADAFLRDLDLKTISRDHDWRAVFTRITSEVDADAGHKRAALVRYLQYLSFRKRLLEYLYSRKSGLEETDEFTLFPEMAMVAGAAEPSGSTHDVCWVRAQAFVRLALGDPVDVELPRRGKLALLLGGHPFGLLGGSTPTLIDQNGLVYFLRRGRNMVGRHPESDVVVDPEFQDVSRAHAIVEWYGGDTASITDLSTRGTLVAAKALRTAIV